MSSVVTEQWSPPIHTMRYEVALTSKPEFIHGQSKYQATHVSLHYTWTGDADTCVVFWTLYTNQIRLGHISPRMGKMFPNDFRSSPPPDWLDDIVTRGMPRLG